MQVFKCKNKYSKPKGKTNSVNIDFLFFDWEYYNNSEPHQGIQQESGIII